MRVVPVLQKLAVLGEIMRKHIVDRMGILTAESLGPKQEITPEGYLLCKDVAIARTGEQLYMADEIGLEPRGDGIVKIERTPDEVFSDNALASFEGKPVTIDHPEGTEVNPKNWRDLTVGIVQNVRRGIGIEDDLLFADLLIYDQRGIDAVRAGLREVSCGYDADYEQISPGLGRQVNIFGNHVALVDRGRAGPRCSIQDKEPSIMAKPSLLQKLRKFLDTEAAEHEKETADEEMSAEEKAAAEAKEKETTDSDDPTEARFAALEQGHAEIKDALGKIMSAITGDENRDPGAERLNGDADPDPEDDEKTGDEGGDLTKPESAEVDPDVVGKTFGDKFREIYSRAEIIAPGIQLPTGDALKAKGAGAALMRKALNLGLKNDQHKPMIEPFLYGKTVEKMTNDAVASAFAGASELIKVHNNQQGKRSGVSTKDFGKVSTPAEINARNRAIWAAKQ